MAQRGGVCSALATTEYGSYLLVSLAPQRGFSAQYSSMIPVVMDRKGPMWVLDGSGHLPSCFGSPASRFRSLAVEVGPNCYGVGGDTCLMSLDSGRLVTFLASQGLALTGQGGALELQVHGGPRQPAALW